MGPGVFWCKAIRGTTGERGVSASVHCLTTIEASIAVGLVYDILHVTPVLKHNSGLSLRESDAFSLTQYYTRRIKA